jgi:putative Ca2+/H+ antiporter (TMEM165/GDT1 family)
LDAFAVAFAVVFLAELGDKSQLMALAFATRYRALTVLLAVAGAALVLLGGSVIIGATVAMLLPTALIQVVAGLTFLAFAAWTLRGERDGEGAADQPASREGGRWALLTVGSAFFLAELGDKTMLATITLATTEEPVATWLGASAGMIAVDAIAVAIGAFLGSRLPERSVRVLAAAAFLVFGLLFIAEGLGLL